MSVGMSAFVALALKSLSAVPHHYRWKKISERLPKKINGPALVKAGFRALLAWRKDGDVGAQTPPFLSPSCSSLPSQPPAPCSPGNELYYMLCGGHVSCYEAVFNLCTLNGRGRLFVCL